MRVCLICGLLLLSVACSDGTSDNKDHVWKDQTDMIDKARGVEDLVGEASEQQRQRIEEQTQ